MEDLKTTDPDMHSTASEPALCQKATTTSGTCRKRRSDTEIDDLPALKAKALCLIAINYLQTTPPQSRDAHNEFKEYLKEMEIVFTGASVGSLVIKVECHSPQSLEKLWKDYSNGRLEKVVQDCFVTEKILKELNLTMHAEHFLKRMHTEVSNKRVTWSFCKSFLLDCEVKCFLSNIQHHQVRRERS